MSITVTRARVKEKCGIDDTSFDLTFDNLIAEVGPVLEYAIRSEHIAEISNAGLQATLNLGATEVVASEFLDQLAREPGAAETLTIGDLTLIPSDVPASRLRASRWRRMRPYLKPDPSGKTSGAVLSAGGKQSSQESEV